MKLHVIETGFFKLDGGAMFGVVPKSIWQKTNPADTNNMCTWAMRCLLLEFDNRFMLIDNGIGDKQDAKFFSHYYLHGEDNLEKSLHKLGLDYPDITDMFLSHLHFDHCGGGIKYNKDKTGYELVFPNATYWSNKEHWCWATQPNKREKASFLTENIIPISNSGHLKYVKGEGRFTSKIFIKYMRGHTDALMVPMIKVNKKVVCFVSDLLPSVGHIPLPYVMGYDTRPLITMEEKENFLNEAADSNYILFLEHDPLYEACTVERTEKGVRLKEAGKLSDFIGS
jgi:glyoxylase-like metal-dependent hydrolase (beta-lactamase superfamily II)